MFEAAPCLNPHKQELHGWGKLFYSGSWLLLAIWFIWGEIELQEIVNENFNCAYIHHYRTWVQAFPSPFSSMDS
jgi:hypothetical protein